MTDQLSQHGEAFNQWWAKTGSVRPDDPPEAWARAAWDAAIRAAVRLLDAHKDRLATDTAYEAAAVFRECRVLAETLFTTPGQWSYRQHLREQTTDEQIEFLRGLPTEQVDQARRTAGPSSMEKLAAKLVLLERQRRS